MRIDAHQHFWKIDRGDYGWITPEITKLYRDFLPEHLSAHLIDHELNGSIVVQAAPTIAETKYILDMSERCESIMGVVGYLDLQDPDHYNHFQSCQAHPKYVGFRVMIQEMADASVILEPSFIHALKRYADMDVPIDLLVRSDQLKQLTELMRQVPYLRGVVDHLGKPRIKDGEIEEWSQWMRELSKYPNLYCKLSGMVTEAEHHEWTYEQFEPYIRLILECFGSDRVMFGSDWPVCLLAASYDEVVEVLRKSLPASWGDEQKLRLFGLNAKEFYKL